MNKMNKRGEEGMSDLLFESFIYLVLCVVFFTIMAFFISLQMNGAGFWSDYYAKQIAESVNYAKPGDVFSLEIQKASEIAVKNRIVNLNKMVVFENDKRKVCVQLSSGFRNCYPYFNNVEIENVKVLYAMPTNKIYFEVKSASDTSLGGVNVTP